MGKTGWKPKKLFKYFCADCGEQLVSTSKICGYSLTTGDPIFAATYICPNKKWYHVGFHPSTVDYLIGEKNV